MVKGCGCDGGSGGGGAGAGTLGTLGMLGYGLLTGFEYGSVEKGFEGLGYWLNGLYRLFVGLFWYEP